MSNSTISALISKVDIGYAKPFRRSDFFKLIERLQPPISRALLVGVSYYVGTLIGLAMTPAGEPLSTFWPPNAILLAALLLAPRRMWWTFIVAVLPFHLFAQLHTGVPLWTALGWFLSNTGEALIGAFCITQFSAGKTFESVRGVLAFIVFGVLVAPFATSFLDAAGVVITGWGRHYWPLSAERFWTNAIAELTIVPAIVIGAAGSLSALRKFTFARWSEAASLVLGTVLLTIFVFGSRLVSTAIMPALLYAPLPMLLWAAIRFGAGGLSLTVLCSSLLSMWYTMHGAVAFPSASMQQNALSLQMLLCLAAMPLLLLSAVMTEAKRTAESLRNVSRNLIEAQEEERHRIAGELHDDLGQQLALANVRVAVLIERSNEYLRSELSDLREQLEAVATTARDLSHGLYPRQLEYVGLSVAVERLCNDVARGKTLSVHLAIGTLPQLPSSISLCLYRVLQEALHNVMKHGQAKNVEVVLNSDGSGVLLRVSDDGVGFDLRRAGDGLGLPSMRERVRSLGGDIVIASSPQNGTQVEVRVKLTQADPDGVIRAA